MGTAVQILVVVLDLGRILANQIRLKDVDHRFRGPLPAVDAAFTNPNRAILTVDADQEPAVPEDSFNFFNLGGFHQVTFVMGVGSGLSVFVGAAARYY